MSDRALVELARQALKEAGGNRDEAARRLRKRIDEDPGLKLALVDELINAEVWRLVRSLSRSMPAASTSAAAAPHLATVAGLRLKSQRAYMEIVLAVTQKPLGDATAADLALEVGMLDSAIRWNWHLKCWYRAISSKLNGRRVRETMTEVQLAALRDQVRLQSRAS